MTQIVGIIGKDSIVIGCESQYTLGYTKQLEQEKMQVIPFKEGHLLVALAGAVSDAKRTLDIMREMAVTEELKDENSGAAIAQKAIDKYRKEILHFYGKPDSLPAEEQDQIFSGEGRHFALMFGYFYGVESDANPALFTIDSAQGIPERQRNYGILGSGSAFAFLMLSKFQIADVVPAEATVLIIDALERAKESDPSCGGGVRIGMLDRVIGLSKHAAWMDEKFCNKITEEVKALNLRNVEWYHRELLSIMKKEFVK